MTTCSKFWHPYETEAKVCPAGMFRDSENLRGGLFRSNRRIKISKDMKPKKEKSNG